MWPWLLGLFVATNLLRNESTDDQNPIKELYKWETNTQLESDYQYIFDIHPDKNGRFFVLLMSKSSKKTFLATVSSTKKDKTGPTFNFYPENKSPSDCNDYESATAIITIDKCNRLWVIDAARSTNSHQCPPKIIVYDLNNDKLLRSYNIPEGQYFAPSFDHLLLVDDDQDCNHSTLYVANYDYKTLLVYSWARNESWTIKENSSIAYVQNRGIAVLGLSPPGFFQKRYLYSFMLDSYKQIFVDTDSLNKYSNSYLTDYYESELEENNMVARFAISPKTGIAFFSRYSKIELFCWNIGLSFNSTNVDVAHKFGNVETIISIKIRSTLNGREKIWILTRISHDDGKMDHKINYGYVDELIKNTNCNIDSSKKSEPISQSGWVKKNFSNYA